MRTTEKWLLIGAVTWILTVPLLSGVTESPAKAFGIILFWLAIPIAYALANKDWAGIGMTKENAKKALIGMAAVTFAYSLVRNLLILYVPASIPYLAASAIETAKILKQGHFGTIAGTFPQLFPIMLIITFLAAASNELFYRGFLFTRLKQTVSWQASIALSALLFGIYHYLNVGLGGFIMGVIVSLVSGALMQKYNNILAPALFHFLQYIITILVFYYLVI